MDVIAAVRAALMLRMRDKAPNVRAMAARALCRIQGVVADEGEEEEEVDYSKDAVTLLYRAAMTAERSKDVRKARRPPRAFIMDN